MMPLIGTPTTIEYMPGKAGARHPAPSQWMHVARTADTAVQWDEIEITEKTFSDIKFDNTLNSHTPPNPSHSLAQW